MASETSLNPNLDPFDSYLVENDGEVTNKSVGIDKKKKSFAPRGEGQLVFSKEGGKLVIFENFCEKLENCVDRYNVRSVAGCIKQEIKEEDDLSVKRELCSHRLVAVSEDVSTTDEENEEFVDFQLESASSCGSESESDGLVRSGSNDKRGKPVCPAICDVCGLEFKGESALTSHKKWKHTNVIKHECKHCGKSFRDSFCLKRHLQRVHTKDGEMRDHSRAVFCSLCNFKAAEGSVVVKHYQQAHGLDMNEQRLRFSSKEKFEKWKKDVESVTKSRYVKFRGTRCNLNGTVISVYRCHRSGYYHSAVKESKARLRTLKSSGSNKINGFCPATISCTSYNGHVRVRYLATHIGHDLDLEKVGLNRVEKDEIAQKLMRKVPMDKILEDIRQTASDAEDLRRIHLATKKDFYNIVQKYNLKGLAVYSQYKTDRVDLESWVGDLQRESKVVRFFKPQGRLVASHPEFKAEDFSLIIASDYQLEMLKHYGNNCICIDNEHKVNANDFELYTVIVLDDYRENFPCCYILSSRADDNALKTYFNIIKSQINVELSPKYFISDWTNSIFNAWSSVNKEIPGRNLFSRWHIEREWKRNLNKIKLKEKQSEVFKKLKQLLAERNHSTFEEMYQDTLSELYKNFETKAYANYLQKFVCDPSSWATCYRLNAEINDSLGIEELLKNIEYYRVKGKKVKCLKKTVLSLIKYSDFKMKERSETGFQERIERKLQEIATRHGISMELQEYTLEITDRGWNILSSSDHQSRKHFVSKDDTECNCSLTCYECNVCIHAYSCTCTDAQVGLNMCRHVHFIVTCLNNRTISDNMDLLNDVLQVQIVNNDQQMTEVHHREAAQRLDDTNRDDGSETPVQFESKKCKFMKRLTNIVNGIETEEELDAVILQNSPLEEILQGVKGKKSTDVSRDESEGPSSENSSYLHRVSDEDSNNDEDELEQIALEVIVES